MKDNLYYVVARNRSVLVSGDLTLQEVVHELYNRKQVFSLRRTLQLYGLTYVEERSFVSKYRSEFNLSKDKSLWDIKVKELDTYKNLLITPYSYKS